MRGVIGTLYIRST